MNDLPTSSTPARPTLALIGAVARNGVIGDGERMPWHLPEDLAYFKRVTQGHPVIMGRRTWDSLPPRFRPLPGRRNLVVTRQAGWQAAGAQACSSLASALAAASDSARIFVIGGAQLYATALPQADELYLTEIDADFAGHVRFPDWPRTAFRERAREHHAVQPPRDYAFDFVVYERRR